MRCIVNFQLVYDALFPARSSNGTIWTGFRMCLVYLQMSCFVILPSSSVRSIRSSTMFIWCIVSIRLTHIRWGVILCFTRWGGAPRWCVTWGVTARRRRAPGDRSDPQDVVVSVSASPARPVFQGTEPLDSARPPGYVRLRVAELTARHSVSLPPSHDTGLAALFARRFSLRVTLGLAALFARRSAGTLI